MEKNIAKETYSKIGLSYTLWYIPYLAIMLICYLIYDKVAGQNGFDTNISMIINYAVRVCFLYPAMYLAIKKLPKFEIKKNKLGFGGFLACICITYATMVCFNIVGMMLNKLIGNLTGQGSVNPLFDAIDGMSPIIQVVIVVILAPICEELLFRKFIIDRVVNYGEVTAMLVSALMFGLFHGNLAQFSYAFGIGIFFAFIYLRTGRIQYTIALHMMVNGLSTFITLVLFRGISISEFMNVYSSGDKDALLKYEMEHLDVFAGFGLFALLIFAIVFVGIILAIVLHSKFVFEHHEEEIPKGKKFSTAILNVGMLILIAFWVFSIVSTQVGFSLFNTIYSLIS